MHSTSLRKTDSDTIVFAKLNKLPLSKSAPVSIKPPTPQNAFGINKPPRGLNRGFTAMNCELNRYEKQFLLTSLKAPLICAVCFLYAVFRSRLTAATRASAALISSAWVLALVASASISCRYFEAASASDKHLCPLCLRVTQSLHTT